MVDPLLPYLARGPKGYRGWPLHEVGGRVEYRPLSWLLATEHPDDAHTGGYSVPSVLRRLTTGAEAKVAGGVPMVTYLFDVDCAKSHRALGGSSAVHADDAWWASQVPRLEALLLAHPGGYVYRTRGGFRIVYCLPQPHVITDGASELEWKRRYLAALAYFARAFELVGDPSISDFPRLLRLPRVTRDGRMQRYETIGDPSRIGAFEYAPTDADEALDLAAVRRLAERERVWRPALGYLARNVLPTPARARTTRAPRPVESRPLSAGAWSQLAADLGRALLGHSGRHAIHLALAGACYARGVALDDGPELARVICTHSGERDDRPQVWATTADRVRGGAAVTGFGYLAQHYPDLAAVVDAALPHDGGAQAARDELDARGVPPTLTAAEVGPRLVDALRSPPSGLSILRVTEGAGKTRAAITVLAEALDAVEGMERVPSKLKALYTAPSHAVLADVAEGLGRRATYLRSILSVVDADGRPLCRHQGQLARLASAGQSVEQWCEGKRRGRNGAPSPCEAFDGCPARAAVEAAHGDDTPRVVIAPHAMLAEGLALVGPNARVFVDEDPEAIITVTHTRAAIDAAVAAMDAFSQREQFRGPVLRALAAGLERGALPHGDDQLGEVWRRGYEALAGDEGWLGDVHAQYDTTDPVEVLALFAIRVAWDWRDAEGDRPAGWHRRSQWAPRLTTTQWARVRVGALDGRVVAASTTHAELARLVAGVLREHPASTDGHAERGHMAVEVAEGDPTRRVLRGVLAAPAVAAALSRLGPTVLLDATADGQVVDVLAGGEVPVTDLRVADGAPITRRLLHWAGASRRQVVQGTVIRWDTGLGRYLAEALRQALAFKAAPTVAIFGWKPVVDVLRAGTDPDGARLLGLVTSTGGRVLLGHYGAARGRNDWMDADVLVSIGDPRPNLGATRAVAAVLGLTRDHGAVYRRATAAEVSQVAGRLRAPWRTSPALHIHVGTIPAASWDARATVQELPKGPDGQLDHRSVVEAVAVYGSGRLAAAALGTSRRTVVRSGENSCGFDQSPSAPSSTIYKNSTAALGAHGDCSESHDISRSSVIRFEVPRVFAKPTQAELIARAGGAPGVMRLLGTPKGTAYHWASGKRRMPDDVAAQIEQALAEAALSKTGTDHGDTP